MESVPYSQQLHLHTLESLCNDLVGGHAVEYGAESELLTLDKPSRSVLSWYSDNQAKWKKNLQAADVDAIVASISILPPDLSPAGSAQSAEDKKYLKLIKLETHRFAGVQAYGTESEAPENFIFEPSKSISLFEGANGSGKTSLVNAIIWCLTGELIRPQRPPERGDIEFEIEIERDDDSTKHNLPPVCPMPSPSVYAPTADVSKVPVDTWVELTFEDQDGEVQPVIRRTISRAARGKIQELAPDLSVLGIDPISFRTGTTMPALLPFIQIGEKSELGQAVAELTGLSLLIYLSKHAGKVSKKISADLTKSVTASISNTDESYTTVLAELQIKIDELPAIAPEAALPAISDDVGLEGELAGLNEHFESCKAKSFSDAVSILGEGFDANDQGQIKDLENMISPAIAKLNEIRELPSAHRLGVLAAVEEEGLVAAEAILTEICNEAAILSDLANSPETAQRNKLYARIAEWMKEFGIDTDEVSHCPVCLSDVQGVKDPVTDTLVKEHITEHLGQDSTLISQSIDRWTQAALGVLATRLPQSLQLEMKQDLPDHPTGLIKSALGDELFSTQSFSGVLSLLRSNLEALFNDVFSGYQRLEVNTLCQLPVLIGSKASALQISLSRVERAIAFARWRLANRNTCLEILGKIIGASSSDGQVDNSELASDSPLRNRLLALQAVTQSAKPINECINTLARLTNLIESRRRDEKKIKAYADAVEALKPIQGLGELAARQVSDLQVKLKRSTEKWRDSVYRNAYARSGHSLADTKVAPEGELSISVGSNGAIAPAQHVSNASALRACLLGFYIAFWEHVLKTRGGLQLMLLDDPQELLDEENEERLADTLADIVGIKAQLFVTTHDQRFATMAVRVANSSNLIEHRSVHPVNNERHTLKIPLAVADIDKKRREFLADEDGTGGARDYLSECRVFIEARLSDLFDDPAYTCNDHRPTLATYVGHARHLMNGNPGHELFQGAAFKKLCNDPALKAGATCLARLNSAHHEGKRHIMPADVSDIKDDLHRLTGLSEQLHREFRLWRRRESSESNTVPSNITVLKPLAPPEINIPIIPDLAAFTGQSPVMGSQDVEQDLFSGEWFADKALFYLRNSMFGFSAPTGSVAIVEVSGEPPRDQNLVIAKYKKKYLARRLLRDKSDSLFVTLATVSTDPRVRPPSLVVSVSEVELFRVVGFFFDGVAPAEMSNKHDAVQVDDAGMFKRIKTCHRLRDTSAEPLALEGQLVLGGAEYLPEDLLRKQDEFVAVALSDGSGICKRVGGALPGSLGHLCQFESIGGRGASEIASLNKDHDLSSEIRSVDTAREIVGVIYES